MHGKEELICQRKVTCMLSGGNTGQYGSQCRYPTACNFVLDIETRQLEDLPPLPVPRYCTLMFKCMMRKGTGSYGGKSKEKGSNLAVQFLRDKYIKAECECKAFSSGSHIWKGLGSVWEVFESTLYREIGNGAKIKVWEDNWMHGGCLRNIIHGP